MKKLLLLLFVLPFLSSKCEDDPKPVTVNCEGVLNMNFKPTLNNQPFVANKVFLINGKKVRFSKFQFYASTISASASADPLGPIPTCDDNANVFFMDFTQLDDSLKSIKGVTTTLSQFRNGSFQDISFGLGVNATLNGKTPSDFTSTNPLSKSEEYWSSWKSYIFFKLEGLMDKDGDGSFETGITYHTGSNDAITSTKFTKNIEISSKGTTLNFDLDMNKLLTGFDFTTLNRIENLTQKEDMKKLMTNLVSAISIK
jgi:hypothetical protein